MNSLPSLLVPLALLGALAWPNHYRDDVRTANESARIDTAIALVDHGTLDLAVVWDQRQPDWRERKKPLNVDVAFVDGRYVIDKAPLLSFLAVPVVALVRWFGLELSYRWFAWLLTVLLAGIPSVLWVASLRQRAGDGCGQAFGIAAITILATPWWVYGGLLFSHALAACLVGTGALLALGSPVEAAPLRPPRSSFLSGLFLGLAVLAEYPTAAVAVVVVLACAADRERRTRLVWIFAGGAAPALLLLAWNWTVFGGPLAFSYAFKANSAMAATHSQGFYGIGLPSAVGAYGVWLSASRGLLFMSPWLLLAVVAAMSLARDRALPVAWRIVFPLMVVVLPSVFAGFGDWHGGRATGPRYMLFALPFFALALVVALPRWLSRRWASLWVPAWAGLVLSSVVVVATSALVMPYLSESLVNPLLEVNLPAALAAGGADTVASAVVGRGLGVAMGLALTLVIVSWALRNAVGKRVPIKAKPVALAVGFAAFLTHFAVATLPESPVEARPRVTEERDLVIAWGER